MTLVRSSAGRWTATDDGINTADRDQFEGVDRESHRSTRRAVDVGSSSTSLVDRSTLVDGAVRDATTTEWHE